MKRTAIRILLVFLWTVMAIVLLLAGVLVCGVKMLRPQVLTPIICKVANDNLNAEVSLAKAQLVFEPAFPVLKLKLDSLAVISNVFPASEKKDLPAYADTLLTFEKFQGDVDVLKFFTKGEIALGDVELLRPGLNIVLDKNGRGNFGIYESGPSEDKDSGTAPLPAVSIHRFALVEPREIRYFNAIDSTEATVVLFSKAEVLNGSGSLYNLKIDGRLGGPYASMLSMNDVAFGLDGNIRWEPSRPMLLAFEEFSLYGAFLRARLDTELAFDSTLTIETARLAVDPVRVTDVLGVIPQEYVKRYKLYEPVFATDATFALDAKLTRPFSPGTDSIPYADIDLRISESALRYGNADIRKLTFDAGLQLRGDNSDSIRVFLRKLEVAGPATSLAFSGELSRPISDPEFRFRVDGGMDFRKLPPVLSDMIPGTLSGRLVLALDAAGKASMLTVNRLHELTVNGDVDGKNLFYLSPDTAKMALADKLCVKFSTQFRRGKSQKFPVMGADINLDTASVLVDGVKMDIAGLRMGAAIENTDKLGDTTVVVPVGAGMKLSRCNIFSITDSAGVRMRGLGGRLVLRRYNDSNKLPLLGADLGVDVLAAGSASSRLLLRDAKIHASTHKNPERARMRAEVNHIADSISRIHPELSADSVLRMAIAKRMNRGGVHRRPRLQSLLSDGDLEVVDWNISSGLRRYLLDWELEGYVRTTSARMFTPYFPLRNRIRNLDIIFNTDTVKLSGVTYRAGKSDMTVSGAITNIKRGLTSRRRKSALKIQFDINSDTIDVNQIAAAAFAGSAYAERIRSGSAGIDMNVDEKELERQLDALADDRADSMGPLLIPTNLDGRLSLNAENVLYDSIAFKNLTGEILLYGGAVNIHDLKATSEAGNMSLSALYAAPKKEDMKFGFGLQLDKFKIERFLKLVPAIDSIMPLMRDFSGIINADIAATADIDSAMNIELPTLDAAVRLSGDSIAFINQETYRTIGKWLRFRDRADNKIKRMSVELVVKDNMLQLFPFSFDIDRYRLGVLGHNDMALNFDYHISVLKSPLPFRFGVNVKGNPDSYKVRFGGAKYKDNMAYESVAVVDSARVNLVQQIESIFRRGVSNSRFAKLNVASPLPAGTLEGEEPVLSAADSVALIREGILPAPVAQPSDTEKLPVEKKKKTKIFSGKKDAIRPKE